MHFYCKELPKDIFILKESFFTTQINIQQWHIIPHSIHQRASNIAGVLEVLTNHL